MNKHDVNKLASAVARVSNNGLEPSKGLKLFRFYQQLKAIRTEIQEYEQKLRIDFGIKEKDNDKETIKAYNDALLELLNEEADIKIDPFLDEDEAIEVFGKALNMEGIDAVLPLVAIEKKD